DRTVCGLLGVDQGWQYFDLYFDQVQGFLSDIDVVRGHRGYRVTMVAHHIGRKYQLVAHNAAIAYSGSVLRCHDSPHPRQLGGLADVETTNASMRDRTAENFAGQDAWECHVIGVDHAPCDAIDSIRLGDAFAQECVFRHAASPYVYTVLCGFLQASRGL